VLGLGPLWTLHAFQHMSREPVLKLASSPGLSLLKYSLRVFSPYSVGCNLFLWGLLLRTSWSSYLSTRLLLILAPLPFYWVRRIFLPPLWVHAPWSFFIHRLDLLLHCLVALSTWSSFSPRETHGRCMARPLVPSPLRIGSYPYSPCFSFFVGFEDSFIAGLYPLVPLNPERGAGH